MTPAPHAPFWIRTISHLTWRINGVIWLERVAPGVFATAVIGAITFYALRRSDMPPGAGWGLLAAGVLVAGCTAWWRSRGGRFSQTEARVLLEYRLRLDAGLTAAEAGLAAWPRPRPIPRNVVVWRSRAVAGWIAGGVAMVLAGLWLPVPATNEVAVRPLEKPPALVQTDAWLDALAKLDVVEPASVEPLAARAQELSRLSPENQYAHSGLEAADTLREQTAAAMQGLAHALESAEAALQPLEAGAASLSAEQLKAAGAQLEAALRAGSMGTLAMRADLQKALEACAANPGSLSADAAAKLGASLAASAKQVRGIAGAAGAGAQIAGEAGLALMPGEGTGSMPGQGGVSRGPGTAPLSFSDTASEVASGKTETVSNTDLSRAALGDLLGTKTGEHELDPAAAQGVTSAGAPASAGAGGEAVWVNRLTPAERAALSRFFK